MSAIGRALLGRANEARVEAILGHLIRAFEEYCNTVSQEDVPFIDAFMGAHNFHKAIGLDLIERQEFTGAARALFLDMARCTWDEAIEKEKRRG